MSTLLRARWSRRIAGIEVSSRPLPTKGMFSPGQPHLDPRFFVGDQIRPDVRAFVLGALEGFWTPLYGDWKAWARPYIAGSAASYWWDTDGDLDILIGIDKPALDRARPANVGVSEIDSCLALTKVLREGLDPQHVATDFGDGKATKVTFFVNPGSFDIRDIKPYAAWDLLADDWAVHPPILPDDWGPEDFPSTMWADANDIADEAMAILQRPEPERSQRGIALFDQLHDLRKRSYGPNGFGWMDYGNFLWQALSQWKILQPLYRLKHPEAMLAMVGAFHEPNVVWWTNKTEAELLDEWEFQMASMDRFDSIHPDMVGQPWPRYHGQGTSGYLAHEGIAYYGYLGEILTVEEAMRRKGITPPQRRKFVSADGSQV